MTLLLPTTTLVLISLYAIFRRILLKSHVYPPGPTPNLIIGNLKDVPQQKPWLTYQRWAKVYGSIVHFTIFNTHIIVLDSMEDVHELFEKRSHLYSNRPYLPTFELMGWGAGTSSLSYGGTLRKHRQFAQQAIIKSSSLLALQPVLTAKVNTLLYSLLGSPSNFLLHHKTFSASVVMAVLYGYDVTGADDRFLIIADEMMDMLTEALLPGAAIVTVLPILRFVPPWFPGASFQKLAVTGRKFAREMRDAPVAMVQDRLAEGTARPSLVSNFLQESSTSMDDLEVLKEACAALYAAGVDTTAAALTTFFHVMLVYPDVQAKAQKELDDVVGMDRLPTFEDRPFLPYIEAIMKELLRWRPVLPLCLPHTTLEDDVYKGYHIPKGATILANIWSINYNTDLYKDPDDFNPERFLDASGKLKEGYDGHAFGFGRRICPGKQLALNSLWLSMASILSVFDLQPPKNAAGQPVVPPIEYSESLIP